ncbi:THC0290_0291 family protein [Cochleicola gelatinilyticus]|uniref:Glutamate dehydrogenase n=1 Tax=Cochleicola gelatinilyticus TaxID=1763537 RepID=A0A167J6R2_9FLAO|nr:glutamate dehydrogenase [Cochleicola gelatinilyticus]OAB80378.1 glutamate dehydrogenase [Cochleicola gelatinilyticus]
MNTRILLLVFLLLAISKQEVYSQLGFSHEVGIITGPVAFYSDFGVRNDFETNSGNVGIGVGLVHYINFAYRADCNCYTRDKYFNDHFKIRTEIDFHKTRLEHFGEFVAPDEESLFSEQLRAMTGSSTVIEVGSQLEFFPLSIRDFAAGAFKVAPYGSLGVHFVSFDPEVTSTLGDIDTSFTTPEKYIGSFQQEPGTTWAAVGSIGIRYKLTQLSDLLLDSRWTYYFSDYVDGLNPTLENNGTRPVPENKSNDWTYWLNIGYIYYLD